MKVEILMSPGCRHGQRTMQLVGEILRETGLAAVVEATVVATEVDAARLAFPGSPTLRVDGIDIDPSPPAGTGLG
ncbi:MAG TPA: hypothetical protein VLT47_06820 [Anaeromyxobacteraceae bacterium]|nr:hypothetical protein [Anaeromyxobacteraceae bacterium]